ncbi:MAG TPA: sulfatase-like hydrolase/transferase [Polyangiaceae bacterium]|nr:sulfatase-like hydrolase/transferase [Polyangiaceae bacterium]
MTSKSDEALPGAGSPSLASRLGLSAAALGRAITGAQLALLLEFGWVVLVERGRFASLWEVWFGGLVHAPAWLVLALIPAVYGWLVGLGLGSGALGMRGGPATARWLVLVPTVLVATLIAYGVGGGRHLATPVVRLGFAVVVGLITLGVGWFITPRLPALVRGRTGLLVALLAAVALGAANRLILVRLYPAFHAGLSLFAVALGAVVAVLATPERRASRVLLTCLGPALAVVGACSLGPASRTAQLLDNFRFLTSESSPALELGVAWTTTLAPVAEQADGVATELGARRSRGQRVELRGRTILLLSVDALRADHLGIYGATRGASPGIDALGREGVVFDAAYAATPHTSYSLTSLMTGKYMRPLLLQGAGADSDTWAGLLRKYGYRTAAFYPPAVFFIDGEHFAGFRERKFDFEYAKVEFAEGEPRVRQVEKYLESTSTSGAKPLFLWVHLFGPHEPYETLGKDFGPRDIDRYDSEINAADATATRLIELVRQRDPQALVILTADHGEEFGDHGGRYHGTSVYEEQVRVPLIVNAPGLGRGRRIAQPVQTIDLLPTVLGGLDVPLPPRLRGRDLGSLLGAQPNTQSNAQREEPGLAVAETDEFTLLAEDRFRLVCSRRSGACRLFDILSDPGQKHDVSAAHPERFAALRARARQLAASHGRYETEGLRSEGKGWPSAILRGISGDAEVAPELAQLLDDADVNVRRKASELLFRLRSKDQATALRLALSREEDALTRRYLALALTRAGQGAPLVRELLGGEDREFQRAAALTLAEVGDASSEEVLLAWWAERDLEFQTAQELLEAFAKLRSRKAVPVLVARLGDVRLRPYIASALQAIGDPAAKLPLVQALHQERYASGRLPLARAAFALGVRDDLAPSLLRFLAVPDPLEGGLELALQAGVLEDIGGPAPAALGRLSQLSDSGVRVELTVPVLARADLLPGARLLLLAQNRGTETGPLSVARGVPRLSAKDDAPRSLPRLDGPDTLQFQVPARPAAQQLAIELPEAWGVRPGQRLALDVFASQGIEVSALAVVPLGRELPPPPPEKWEETGESPNGSPDETTP